MFALYLLHLFNGLQLQIYGLIRVSLAYGELCYYTAGADYFLEMWQMYSQSECDDDIDLICKEKLHSYGSDSDSFGIWLDVLDTDELEQNVRDFGIRNEENQSRIRFCITEL